MNLPLANEQRAKVEAFQRRHRTAVLTLLFTDIVGSVQLKQDLGDSKAVTLIQDHHRMLQELQGRFPEAEEVGQAGDSFFIIFVRPSDAVRFALLLQSHLRSFEQEHGRPMRDRIGIHIGEVVVQEHQDSAKTKDLYGIQVDTAARVMSLAEGNQVLLTRAAFDNARPVLKGEDLEGIGALSWMNHGPYLLKGVEEPLEICEVGETDKAVLKPPPDSEKVHRYLSPDSEPVLGWRPALGQAVPNTQWMLERKLGEGGFGEVWVAHNEKLKERRVFKFCFRADRVRSLKRELALFQILKKSVGSHPNIVGVQDVYFDQPPFYLVMDYGEGKDLQAWCEAQGGADKVPLATRLEIVAQIADALQAAHDAGIIHRDVKPSNILISNSTQPQPSTIESQATAKLTDFGIGQVVSQEVLAGMTKAGFSRPATMSNSPGSGTLMYMAPELLAGKPASIRSDIYSLGVVLFQLLAGDFAKPVTPDWAREVQDPLLREDLEKCFAGNPQERFTGAGELANRLRTLEQRQVAVAEQQAALTALERAAYRRGVLRTATLAACVVMVIVGLALYAFTQARRANEEQALAEAAATETKMTLASSDFLQAVRLISEDNGIDALAYLERSLSANPTDDAAATRLATLMVYHSWMLPGLSLEHSDFVASAQFSPDGKRIVTGSEHTARVWDAQSGQPLTKPFEHSSQASSGGVIRQIKVQFSPDGKRIVTYSPEDRIARIWDALTGQPLAKPLEHGTNGTATSLTLCPAQFSPDGKRIVTASGDGTARVWDAGTGEQLEGALKDAIWVLAAQFSPDGKRVVTASADKTARIWDVESGQPLTEPLKHDSTVISAQFSPDGKRVATASADRTARVWDAQSGQPLTGPLRHRHQVDSALFSPDGKRIVTASWDTTARVWDAQSGQPLTDPLKHDGPVLSAQFSPEGKRIVTVSMNSEVRLWDSQSGLPLTDPLKPGSAVGSAQFSPDGRRVLIAAGRAACVWDVQTTHPQAQLLRHGGAVYSAQFSPDGNLVATASSDDTARVWDAHTGRPLSETLKHGGGMQSVQFSPDGKRIMTITDPGAARVWDAQTGKPFGEPLKHAGKIHSAQFSPDSNRIVTASEDSTVRVWDAQTGQPLTEPLKHSGPVYEAQFSADGKRILTSDSGTERIWDAQSGKRVKTPSKKATLRGPQYSADGKRMIETWEVANAARVLDAETHQPLTGPLKHGGRVTSGRFSPDGKRIVTASEDGTARVWDSQSGQPLTGPFVHGGSVDAAEFSPDGKRIVTASADKTARVWDVAPSQARCPVWLLQLSQAISGQSLNQHGGLGPTIVTNNMGRAGSYTAGPITDKERAETISQIRQKLSQSPDDDDWVVWGRWFLADPSTRTISPFSKITVPEYIENRIRENTAESLNEAEMLAAGNLELLARISEKRVLNEQKELEQRCRDQALALVNQGKLTEAEPLYREALAISLKLYPNNPRKWQSIINRLVDILDRRGKYEDAGRLLDELLTPSVTSQPDSAGLLRARAGQFARRGRWKESAADIVKVIEFQPTDHVLYHMLAPLLVASGDPDGYCRNCRLVVRRFAQTRDPVTAQLMAKACLIAPCSGLNLEAVGKLADVAVTADPLHRFFCLVPFRQRTERVPPRPLYQRFGMDEKGSGKRGRGVLPRCGRLHGAGHGAVSTRREGRSAHRAH